MRSGKKKIESWDQNRRAAFFSSSEFTGRGKGNLKEKISYKNERVIRR